MVPNVLEEGISPTVADAAPGSKRVASPLVTLEDLDNATRSRLLATCRALGLKRYSRLRKAALVERLRAEMERRVATTRPAVDERNPSMRPSRRGVVPWGYGLDRVRAMAVDPERLFVYWEVTDGAIAAAARRLDLSDGSTRLTLRVYDTTGRLFDGTNAHRHFDQPVPRGARQWFLRVDRPGSEAFVELGVRSDEGVFVRITRSRRVVFARREPGPAREPDWVTVRPESAPAGEEHGSGAKASSASTSRPLAEPAAAAPERSERAPADEAPPSTVVASHGASERLYPGASERLGSRERDHD